MTLISPTQVADGSPRVAANINTPVNEIAAVVNGNLDNSNIATGAGIDGAKLADASVTNAKLATNAAWSSWTPTWTNLTVSGSTVTAKYQQIGKTVFWRLNVILGGGNAPTGALSFTLPVTSANYAGNASSQRIGTAEYLDAGVTGYVGSVAWASTTTGRLFVTLASGTYGQDADLSATVPHAWGNTDEIHASGVYEAA